MSFTGRCGSTSLKDIPFKGMVINRKKTGELYWTQQTISAMRDEAGSMTHFVSVSQDITELRKQQEQDFQLQLAKASAATLLYRPASLYQDLILAHPRIRLTKLGGLF
jgi:prephenate dehydratase